MTRHVSPSCQTMRHGKDTCGRWAVSTCTNVCCACASVCVCVLDCVHAFMCLREGRAQCILTAAV